jgi:NAD(P)-dependent dehydrogenase (short-subunit alcohol dehydrogenase family)
MDGMTGSLSGRTALITGASSGIGAGVARRFAREGARLVLAARRADRLEALAEELRGLGADVLTRPADVTQEAEVLGLYADAEAFGAVDILVNNAGMVSHKSTLELELDEWNRLIALNLTAAFLCAREAMRVMKPRGRGKIINIGSLSAQMPRADTIAYATSKFGMEGMTRSLALDGREYGITASIVHPGITMSELASDAGGSVAGPMLMEADTTAQVIALMASVPFEANLLTATILPIAQPYLGRG